MAPQACDIGIHFDTKSMSIAFPDPKVEGAQVLMRGITRWESTKISPAKAMRQLRGCAGEIRTTNEAWETMDAPVDQLISHGDENNEGVTWPNVEIGNSRRHSTSAIETRTSDQD